MGYSKKGQGHNKNYVYKVEGLFGNIIKGRDSFAKKAKEWKGSLIKMRECRGYGHICPPLLPFPTEKQGREGGSPAAACAGGSGRDGSHGVGGKREGGS